RRRHRRRGGQLAGGRLEPVHPEPAAVRDRFGLPAGRDDRRGRAGPAPVKGPLMLEITTNHYLVLSFVLFAIGIFGVAARKNMITVLMSIELILNSVNINLVAFSYQHGNLTGQIFSIFTITVAAGEAAVGLGILIAYFRLRETTALDQARDLKG